MSKAIRHLMFLIIPVVSVLLCVLLRLAQGEKTEEVVFGIMLGLVFDFIYLIVLLIFKKKATQKWAKQCSQVGCTVLLI